MRVLLLSCVFVAVWLTPAGAQDKKPVKPAEPTLTVSFKSTPWPVVLEWLSDQTGLPLGAKGTMPKGTFTFVPPAGKKLTLPEVLDVINEGLLATNHLLIRGEKSLILVPADARVDPSLVPRVGIEQLKSRGETELVGVDVPLHGLSAEDIAPDVRKMMGPFGDAIVLAKANKLILQDTAGNVKRILKMLHDIEAGVADAVETLAFHCKHIRAGAAEEILRKALGTPAKGKKSDVFIVAVEDRSNMVLIRGSAAIIVQAKEILARIDVPDGKGEPAREAAVLEMFPVPSGFAETMAKMLQDIYRDTSKVRVWAIAPDRVAVWARPDDMIEITRHLQPHIASIVEVIPVGTGGERVIATLRSMFGDTKRGAPFFELEPALNVVIIRGSASQVKEVKEAIRVLATPEKTGNLRVINIEKGSAKALAEAIAEAMAKMRVNPIKVVIPGKDEGPSKEMEKKKAGLPGRADAPVTLTAAGNRLIITTDDPEAMALAVELAALFQRPAGDGDFEIVRLKNAAALDLARVIDEAFHGKEKGRVERVRIVADPPTNSLILRATPLDMITIRNLIRALDVDEGASKPGGPKGSGNSSSGLGEGSGNSTSGLGKGSGNSTSGLGGDGGGGGFRGPGSFFPGGGGGFPGGGGGGFSPGGGGFPGGGGGGFFPGGGGSRSPNGSGSFGGGFGGGTRGGGTIGGFGPGTRSPFGGSSNFKGGTKEPSKGGGSKGRGNR